MSQAAAHRARNVVLALVVSLGYVAGCGSSSSSPGDVLDASVVIDGTLKEPCSAPFGITKVDPNAVDNIALGEAYLFDANKMHHFDIVVAPADLALLDSNPIAETYVPAQVVFEGFRYDGVSVRYKGGYNSLRACVDSNGNVDRNLCRKLSLKLSFNTQTKCGRFFGQRKINLNSMVKDESLLRERIGMEMTKIAGATAPRVVHATASLNGQDRGIFSIVEQVDKEFLQENYSDASGDLYKAVWPLYPDDRLYKRALETNATTSNAGRMLGLYQALQSTTDQTFAADIAPFLEPARVARVIAVGLLMGNDDGPAQIYCFPEPGRPDFCGNGNFYWYDQPNLGFDLISWDLDYSLHDHALSLAPTIFTQQLNNCDPILICKYVEEKYGGNRNCDPEGPTMIHPACDPLIRQSVRSRPADFRDAYVKILAAFDSGQIMNDFDRFRTQIQPSIAAEGPLGLSTNRWSTDVDDLRTSLLRRQSQLRAYLAQ
jgi:hypothetical protein